MGTLECNFLHTHSLTFKMTKKIIVVTMMTYKSKTLFGENATNTCILTHLKTP